MADDADESADTGNPAADAAAQAASAVVEQQQRVEENANSAIEAARAETDRANEEARRIASAALNTELGAQIQSTRQEFSTWQTTQAETLAQMQARLRTAETEAGNLKAALGTLLGALNPASQSQSTPPASAPAAEAPPANQANPAESANAGDPPGQQSPPPPSSRKGKRLL